VTTTYDALGRAVERGNNGTYTQVVYSPTGDKLAFMNGQAVQQYFIPLAAGMKAVYNGSGGAGALQFFRHVDWLKPAQPRKGGLSARLKSCPDTCPPKSKFSGSVGKIRNPAEGSGVSHLTRPMAVDANWPGPRFARSAFALLRFLR